MVLVSDKKYACETCIKGHRSSACKHTDRPLFEIKKKGRPVTQCSHCRELRKSKQVHVKCICESKDELGSEMFVAPAVSKKGSTKVPASAAFPNGLPEALEASVALQILSEGSSDSDHPGDHPCSCKDGGDCHCCTPRKSAPKKLSKGADDSGPHRAGSSKARHATISSSSPPPLSVLARVAELRPVLPRPPPRDTNVTGPLHSPSSVVAHSHAARHHTHENMFFSPYGRALEHSHPEYVYARSEGSSDHDHSHQQPNTYREPYFPLPPAPTENGSGTEAQPSWALPDNFLSLCGCGDTCSCPGCMQHGNFAPANPADLTVFNQCTNPGACTLCFECSVMSQPSDPPPNTALSIYEPSPNIDEWIRQVSAPTAAYQLYQPQPQADMQQLTNLPPGWELQLPQISEPTSSSESEDHCKCPPGLCVCSECREDDYVTTRFATSGERSCCSANTEHDRKGPSSGDKQEATRSNGNPRTSTFLTVPVPGIPRSRSSSSSSSQSSHKSGISRMSSGARCGPLQMTPIHTRASSQSGQPSTTLVAPGRGMYPSSMSVSPPPHMNGESSGLGSNYIGAMAGVDISRASPDGSRIEPYAQYDPSLDGMQLY